MLVYFPRFSCGIPEVTRCFRSALQGVLPVHAETATSSGGSSPKSNVSHSSGFLCPYVQSSASSCRYASQQHPLTKGPGPGGLRQLTTFLIEVEQTLKVATVHSISSTLALFPGAYIDERRLPSNSHSDYYQTSSETIRISCAL